MKNTFWLCLTLLVCTIIICTTVIYVKHLEVENAKTNTENVAEDFANDLFQGIYESFTSN